MNYADLFSTLTLVDIDIGQWDGTITLTPEDLGLPSTKELRRNVDLGSVRVVQSDFLAPTRATLYEARKVTDTRGIKVPCFTGTRAVPNAGLPGVQAELNRLADALAVVVGKVKEAYPAALEEQRPILIEVFHQAGAPDPIAAATAALARAPSAEYVASRFYLTWRSFALSAPLGAALNTSEEADVSSLTAQIVAELRLEVREAIASLRRSDGTLSGRSLAAASRALARAKEKNVFDDPVLQQVIALMQPVIDALEAMRPEDRAGAAKDLLDVAAGKIEEPIGQALPGILAGFQKRRITLAPRQNGAA